MNIPDILKRGALITAAALFLCAGIGAGDDAAESGDDEVKIILKEEETNTAKKVNNIICPVSDDDIDKDTCIKVEYKGRIYNLCCKACAKHFKKYPEKFSKTATPPR